MKLKIGDYVQADAKYSFDPVVGKVIAIRKTDLVIYIKVLKYFGRSMGTYVEDDKWGYAFDRVKKIHRSEYQILKLIE